MKKILLISLLTCLFIVGCSNKENSNIVIELEGNPTTGYEWTCEINDENIASVEVEYISPKTDALGAPGKYNITLTGKKEGETKLVCKYARSWEETEYDETKTYNIEVDSNLNISSEEIK